MALFLNLRLKEPRKHEVTTTNVIMYCQFHGKVTRPRQILSYQEACLGDTSYEGHKTRFPLGWEAKDVLKLLYHFKPFKKIKP